MTELLQTRREIGATRARCSLESGLPPRLREGGGPVVGPSPEVGPLEPAAPGGAGWPTLPVQALLGGGATGALFTAEPEPPFGRFPVPA